MIIMSIGYATFIPTNTPLLGHKYSLKPEWRVDIEAPLQEELLYTDITNWSSTVSADKKGVTYAGARLIYHDPKSSNATSTLTTGMSIPSTGYYRIYLRMKRGPTENRTPSTLNINGQDYHFNGYQSFTAMNTVDFGRQRISSGSITLTLTLQKWCNVEQVILKRVIPMSTEGVHGNRRLKINKTDFTQNNISDMNTFSLETPAIPQAWPNGHYHQENELFNLIYEFGSPITISMGATSNELKPVFGGYISKVNYNHDESSFTLEGPDRMMDLIREPAYHNFVVGAATSTPDKKDYPYYSLSDIYSAGKYVAETIEYPLRTDQIRYMGIESDTEYSTRMNINFKDSNSLSRCSWTRNGFIPQRDGSNGYPAPGLKLSHGTKLGNTYFTLFKDYTNPVNINDYPLLMFDYMAPNLSYNVGYLEGKKKVLKSKNIKSPLLFDIRIRIHGKGETPANGVYYYIPFSSQERHPNTLQKPHNYVCDGQWKRFIANLKTLLDRFKPNDEYYLTELSLVNYNGWNETYYNTVINQAYKIRKRYKSGKNKGKYYYQTKYKKVRKTNRINRYMYLDNFVTTTEDAATRDKQDEDIGTSFEFLQKAANDSNHNIMILPGLERRDDALAVLPNNSIILDQEGNSGTNILGISEINNSPQETICNQATKRYTINEETTGTQFYEDRYHRIVHGPFEKYEVQSDNNNNLIAYLGAKQEVLDNKIPGWSFTLDMLGAADIITNQYMNVNIPSIPWLKGTYPVKSVEQFIDNEEDIQIMTRVGLNQPSQRYRNRINRMNQILQKQRLASRLAGNRINRSKLVGNSSPGATI